MTEYSCDSIQVLKGLEGVRRRPGMYVGDTSTTGLHHLLWSVIDDIVDAHRAGYASEIRVELRPDGWVAVRDDAPGMSTSRLPKSSLFEDALEPETPTTPLELWFMQLWSGSRWADARPTTGLCGCGNAVVNALSERLEVETVHDGVAWTQAFERGQRASDARRIGTSTREGTSIRFRPDPSIFGSITLDPNVVGTRLHELAALHPHLRVWFQEQRIVARGGVTGWARRLAAERGEIVAGTTLGYAISGIDVEIGLAWNRDGAPLLRSYVNYHPTPRGSHIEGLWLGFAQYARALRSPARRVAHVREAVGAGLVMVMNVHMVAPRFTSQTRDAIRSPTAMHAVRDAVDALRRWSSGQPWDVRRLLDTRLQVPTA